MDNWLGLLGSEVHLMAKEGKYAQLRLPSGEFRLVESRV